MSENPIDAGPDRASDLRTEIVKILGYSEWHQVHNPAAKIAVLHADLIAKLVERHQAEDQAAIRDMADAMVLFLHPGEPDCPACVVATKHDAAIKRAHQAAP